MQHRRESYSKEETFVCKKPIVHNVGASTGHWQLKNMLKKTDYTFTNSGPASDFYLMMPYKKAVVTYNPYTKSALSLFNVRYSPTCLDTKKNLIVLGNEHGEISIYDDNLPEKDVSTLKISNSITNSLLLHDRYLLSCSNDCNLRIFDLKKDLTQIYSIKHPWPVNNCLIKENLLITTGDKNQVRITDIRSTDVIINKVLTHNPVENFTILETVSDAGFGISINDSMTQLAIATQDGFVCVYDIQNIEEELKKSNSINLERSAFNFHTESRLHAKRSFPPSVSISAYQFNARGAIRGVNFAPNNLDLLIFTENMNYMNIVDTRLGNLCEVKERGKIPNQVNYDVLFQSTQRQVVEVGSNDTEITGIVINKKCNNIFIASEENIYEYKINAGNRKRRR